MGNPSSEAARRRSPRRIQRKNGERSLLLCPRRCLSGSCNSSSIPTSRTPDCLSGSLDTALNRFHESQMTKSEAKKFCEEEQQVPARLVEIDSAEENRAIIAEMQRRNSFSRKINFWLGITDRHSEGQWLLESTFKSVVFTDWSPTMLEYLDVARTVPLSMNWKSGMMPIATAHQSMGG